MGAKENALTLVLLGSTWLYHEHRWSVDGQWTADSRQQSEEGVVAVYSVLNSVDLVCNEGALRCVLLFLPRVLVQKTERERDLATHAFAVLSRKAADMPMCRTSFAGLLRCFEMIHGQVGQQGV